MDPTESGTSTPPKALSEFEVLSALTAVIDPELGLDVVSLGLVYAVEISDAEVRITHTLTSPGCPLGAEIAAAMIAEVQAIAAGRRVQPALVFSPPWGPDRMSEDVKFALGM